MEMAATLTGVLYIYLAIIKKRSLWLAGILSSALFFVVFFRSHLYAYAFLYVYYVGAGIYGWFAWSASVTKESAIQIRFATKKEKTGSLLALIAIACILYFILKGLNPTWLAIADAMISAAGVIATWMLARKWIDQWIWWILINAVSAGIMLYKGLYFSAFLFILYLIMAIRGYSQWRKNLPT